MQKDKKAQARHPVWRELQEQAGNLARDEPLLRSYYHSSVLNHSSLEHALAYVLAEKLNSSTVSELALNDVFNQCLIEHPTVVDSVVLDLIAYFERDPACDNYCKPFLHYKGFQATQAYRFAHLLWEDGRTALARYIQSQSSRVFGVDIHPAAKIGYGLMLDHASDIVIGETAEVGNNVSMLHGVSLGGSGASSGKRHPVVGDGVMVSCGAQLLGRIHIGEGVRIGGGSLILESVPAHVTVVGVPANIVGKPDTEFPSLSMDQTVVD